MDSKDTTTSIPTYVVEDHDEALPLVYRAIGAKKLPLRGIGLIHFDAHPDLLSPNIKADECCDKEKLFAYTSIAEWILPAVYMGHFGCVVWLKPSWCTQIPDGVHQLLVGRDETSGYIRVGTPLSYFISELLYVPEEELENVRTVSLHVITVRLLKEPSGNDTDNFENGSNRSNPSEQDCAGRLPASSCFPLNTCGLKTAFLSANIGKKSEREEKEEKEGEEKEGEEEQEEEERIGHLNKRNTDSCVDDTSELAPPAKRPRHSVTLSSHLGEDLRSAETVEGSFKEASGSPTVTNKPEGIHRDIDTTFLAEDPSPVLTTVLGQCSAWVLDVDLDFFSTGNPFKSLFTDDQYDLLGKLYALAEPEGPSCPQSLEECVEMRCSQLESLQQMWSNDSQSLQGDDSVQMKQVRSLVGTFHDDCDGAVVTAEYIHIAGMMTDLPCHVSSEEEIRGLVAAVKELLQCCTNCKLEPSMITIARSTEDDYTPQSQIEAIQDLVVGTLEDTYRSLHIHYHYLNTKARHEV